MNALAARLIALLLLAVAMPATAQRSRFPHARHAKLFPTCTACHSGIVTGDTARDLPAATTCVACHNGRDVRAVTWSPAPRRPTNLVFSHTSHLVTSASRGSPAQCVSCHADVTDTAYMHVRAASGGGCVTCHTNATAEHLAETAVCKTCHTTLADSRGLTAATIAAFPKPASHAANDFAADHAPKTAADVARCATCHARESCARCHANASKVQAIAQLAPDTRIAALMRGRAATYPTPATHRNAAWATSHAADASRSVSTCANCHTQSSCRSCHVGERPPRVIADLPMPVDGGATGVLLTRATVHEAGFLTQHKTSAAAGRLDCMQCHQQRECSSCHEGSSARRYHAADFVSRHASAAFSQEQTCASCHRTETFCRSCHLKTGITTTGATAGAAHTGQPLWLLQHGEAARRGLPGCTTCHQQRDCLRCHSDLGLKVNPHGSDFNPSRVSARAKQMCTTCHITDPLKR